MFVRVNKIIYDSVESNLLEWTQKLPPSLVAGYVRVRSYLPWGLLGLFATLAWLPESAMAQIGITPFYENDTGLPSYVPQASPDQAGQDSLSALQAISDATSSFDTLWQTYLTQDSPFFGVVLHATNYITVTGFLLWALAAVWKWLESNYKKFPWQMMLTPVLIAMLFANGGQLTIIVVAVL